MDERVVLVVEDNPNFRKLLQVMLSATLGVRTVLAADGKEALAQLQTVRPAVVLLDLGIPEIDGLQLVQQLRSQPATQEIPVIAVTAMARARAEAMEAGCSDFIEKPFELDHLIAKVQQYLPGKEHPTVP